MRFVAGEPDPPRSGSFYGSVFPCILVINDHSWRVPAHFVFDKDCGVFRFITFRVLAIFVHSSDDGSRLQRGITIALDLLVGSPGADKRGVRGQCVYQLHALAIVFSRSGNGCLILVARDDPLPAGLMAHADALLLV